MKRVSVRMLPGAPPDSELRCRVSASRTYDPVPENYKSEIPDDEYMKDIDGTLLGFLKYDKRGLDDGAFMVEEILGLEDDSSDTGVVFELIDADGKVWTETYEVDVPDDKDD